MQIYDISEYMSNGYLRFVTGYGNTYSYSIYSYQTYPFETWYHAFMIKQVVALIYCIADQKQPITMLLQVLTKSISRTC